MKVLFLPHDRLSRGQLDGLRHAFGSWNVEVYDYLDRIRKGEGDVDRGFVEMVTHGKPELVWMNLQDAGFIRADTIERARRASPKSNFVHWIGDYLPTISPLVASVSKVCDATLVSSRGQLTDFTAIGARQAVYCQAAVDWTVDVLGWPDWTPPFRVPDVVFVGNCYLDGPWPKGTEQRLRAVRTLQEAGIDFGVVGSGWPDGVPVIGTCTVDQQGQVYRRAKVAINVNHANDVQNYYSDRMLIAMASGTPVVARYVPGLEDEFDQEDLPWFGDEAGLLDEVDYLLRHPHCAEAIGAQGRYKVMREHSWYARMLDVLRTIRVI